MEPQVIDLTLSELLDQDQIWVTKEDGVINIADMTREHRRRSAGWLLKRAPALVLAALDPDEFAQEAFRRISNPESWIRDTVLYRRLTSGGGEPVNYDQAA